MWRQSARNAGRSPGTDLRGPQGVFCQPLRSNFVDMQTPAWQDKAQEDDVFTSFAGATELTAELAGTFIKEILVSSPTEIEIVWKFRDVFDMLGNDNG